MNIVNVVIVCLSLISSRVLAFSTDWEDDFTYYAYIDEDDKVKLYWRDVEGDDDKMEFGLEVEATGWIALGISPRGQMPSSDIMIGWVDDDGGVYLQDRYTTGRTPPLYDEEQDLELVEGEEADGMTRLRWIRDKYTCNADDMSISRGTTRFIWAFHSTDDPSTECWDSFSTISYHDNKGSQSLNLHAGITEEVTLSDDITTHDFLMDEVVVPDSDTTYYCKLFKVPEFSETKYIEKFAPVVEEGNEALVHHVLLYDCPEEIATMNHSVTEGDCDDFEQNMPSLWCRQYTVLFVWAIGGNDVYMPDTTAMPIGGDSNTHWALLEMHYDNPKLESGRIDNSGTRMYYSSTAPQYEVSVLGIGLNTNVWGQYIPAGLSNAHNAAYMKSDCSAAAFPEDGIKVFGSFLHQHTIGSALNLRLIRDGVELEPIDTNLDYDFNYQQTIMFDDPVVILPGDEIILDCYTNSSNRDYTTTGGEKSSQEMCIAFLFYYPAVAMTGSFGQKTGEAYAQWFKDASNAGYVSATESEIDDIFYALQQEIINSQDGGMYSEFDDALEFDGSMDGALEFYNRLWNASYPEYNKQTLACIGNSDDFFMYYPSIARNESFEPYDLGIECENAINPAEIVLDDVECVSTGGTPAPITISTSEVSTTEDSSEPGSNAPIKTIIFVWIAVIAALFC